MCQEQGKSFGVSVRQTLLPQLVDVGRWNCFQVGEGNPSMSTISLALGSGRGSVETVNNPNILYPFLVGWLLLAKAPLRGARATNYQPQQ